MWDRQLPELRSFRVVTYEHSPRPEVAALARDVLALADGLGIARFSFCGLSLGGMVGMWLAAEVPDRVDRLVLACTSARFGEPGTWAQRAAEVRAEGMEPVARDALGKWFTPAFRDREPFLEMQLRTPPEHYALGLEAIGAFDFRNRLEEIAAPTLVIAGAEDTATPRADADVLAERIPGARLVVLPSAAHLANVEQPDAFNDAVLAHLAR
jgi:3-oxoadipate enol-lactonase